MIILARVLLSHRVVRGDNPFQGLIIPRVVRGDDPRTRDALSAASLLVPSK